MNIKKMKRSTQIAIFAGSGSGPSVPTAEGTAINITDSVAGTLQSVYIRGRSTMSGSDIVSVGDNGLIVKTNGLNMLKNGVTETITLSPGCTMVPQSDGTLFCTGSTNVEKVIIANMFSGSLSASTGNDKVKHLPNDKYRLVFQFMPAHQVYHSVRGTNSETASASGSSIATGQTFTITDTYKYNWLMYETYGEEIDFGSGYTYKPMIVRYDEYVSGMTYVPYVETLATITTGLPLRSTIDGTVFDELNSKTGKVIKRCEVVDGNVVPLASTVELSLSLVEISALASLATYAGSTHVNATDYPYLKVTYETE